jgi:hypothetical protein
MKKLDVILSHEAIMRILEDKVTAIQAELATEPDREKRQALLYSWGVILELKVDVSKHIIIVEKTA